MRNVLAHARRSGRRVASAFIATAFVQDDASAARAEWCRVADHLRPKLPKLAAFLDEAETDVLAYMTFPPQHRAKLRSTTLNRAVSMARSSGEPTSSASSPTRIRLVDAILLE
jgi:putative transposase